MKFEFGDKVKFKNEEKVHPDLRDKEFCLLGFGNSAFALIEWDKRGQYFFEYFNGNINESLIKVEPL